MIVCWRIVDVISFRLIGCYIWLSTKQQTFHGFDPSGINKANEIGYFTKKYSYLFLEFDGYYMCFSPLKPKGNTSSLEDFAAPIPWIDYESKCE